MKPKVSVIVPCFNQRPDLLIQAVESVWGQTYPHHETLLIDDGSTDPITLDALDQLAQQPGTAIYRKPNGGLASARNLGLANATGAFIQFLDADDLLFKTKLERQIEYFEKHPSTDICLTNSRLCSETGQDTGHVPGMIFRLSSDPLQDFLLRWEGDLSFPIHSALFRSGLRDAGWMAFRDDLKAKEDWVFWVQLALQTTRFGLLDEDLVYYRQHGSNMSRQVEQMTSQVVRAGFYIYELLPMEKREAFLERFCRHIGEGYIGTARVDTLQKMATNRLVFSGQGACPNPGFRTGYRLFLKSLAFAFQKRLRRFLPA